MQQVAKPRMSTVKAYETLSKNMGHEAARMLVDYLEGEIPANIQDSVKYLATKEDVAKVETQVAHVKGELKEEIAKTEAKLIEKINNVETQVAHVKGELKEEIAHVKGEIVKTEARLAKAILQVQVKMEESLKVQTRWMIGVLLTLMGLIVTLYIKK